MNEGKPKPRDLLEQLRKYRKPEPFELPEGKGTIYVQPLRMVERVGLADVMATCKQENVGDNTTAYRTAAYCAHHGTVDDMGRRVFQSVEEATTVLDDISDTIIFDIAQRILDLSGLSKHSAEDAEKNS